MAATITIGTSTRDLYFAPVEVPESHMRDVPRTNPLYVVSGLALPPAHVMPSDPGLNRLVWPVTGLSQYAIGHVLVDNETATLTATDVTLNLTDGDADAPRVFNVTVLNRRPLSDTRTSLSHAPSATVEDPFDGWILTLVDRRYLRRKTVSSGDIIARATWGQLINSLGAHAGFTMPSASVIQALVHADFGAPDSTYWSPAELAGESYAVAADAAALAVGLRIVYKPDDTVEVQRAAESNAAYTAWLAATGRDEFANGGLSRDRWASPGTVRCNGFDTVVPGTGGRLTDTDHADLRSTLPAFRNRWVSTLADWFDATGVTADVRGFVLPPPCGTIKHVEYDLPTCHTRIVRQPARYPLPLLPEFKEDACPQGPVWSGPIDLVEVRDDAGTPALWRLRRTLTLMTNAEGCLTATETPVTETRLGCLAACPSPPPPPPTGTWTCPSCPLPLPAQICVTITGTCPELTPAVVVGTYDAIQGGWVVNYFQPNGTFVTGVIRCSFIYTDVPDTSGYKFNFEGSTNCPSIFPVVYQYQLYSNQTTGPVTCSPLGFAIQLYFGMFTLTVSELPCGSPPPPPPPPADAPCPRCCPLTVQLTRGAETVTKVVPCIDQGGIWFGQFEPFAFGTCSDLTQISITCSNPVTGALSMLIYRNGQVSHVIAAEPLNRSGPVWTGNGSGCGGDTITVTIATTPECTPPAPGGGGIGDV